MKKVLLLTAALALVATSAFAAGGSLFLAWDDCVANGGVGFKNFDCANGLGGELYASFILNSATPAPGVVTLNTITDVNINGAAVVPDFWHFEAGGCNYGFLVLADKRPSGMCAGTAVIMCGLTGAGCNEFITAYGVDYPVDGRARILVTLARMASSPVILAAAPTINFAYQLGIDASFSSELNAPDGCVGCASVASIALNSIVLESAELNTSGEATADIITSDMAGSVPQVCVNGETCLNVPVKNKTWGQLKALYR